MITDYSFYTTEFYGNAISDKAAFETAAVKAERYVLNLTGGRFSNESDCCEELFKMAVCAVAECFYKETQSNGKTSESLDNHSVSYAVKSFEEQKRLKYEAATLYLRNTGLLISGAMR